MRVTPMQTRKKSLKIKLVWIFFVSMAAFISLSTLSYRWTLRSVVLTRSDINSRLLIQIISHQPFGVTRP